MMQRPYIPAGCDQQGRVPDGRRAMTHAEQEAADAIDRKVLEACARARWQPIKLEGARESFELPAATLDSQAATLDAQASLPTWRERLAKWWAGFRAGLLP